MIILGLESILPINYLSLKSKYSSERRTITVNKEAASIP